MKPYYEEAGITIYHGDCLEVLPTLAPVDLLLTDPPYGIGATKGTGKYGRLKFSSELTWDDGTPPAWVFGMMMERASRHIIWGGNYYELPPSRQYLVWDKGAGFKGRDFAECEMAWCSMDGNAKVLTRDPLAERDYADKQHPTQKPVAVMLWCIQVAGEVSSVLDPFAGSGTTGVAAKLAGVPAILIEREERYCEIAAKRLAQGVLFGSRP